MCCHYTTLQSSGTRYVYLRRLEFLTAQTTATTMRARDTITNPIQIGASTHHQDQSMTWQSLSTINATVSKPGNPMPPLAEELDELLIIQCVNVKIVGIKGIEPIQSKDNRFTVCPDSPASAYSHVSTTPSKMESYHRRYGSRRQPGISLCGLIEIPFHAFLDRIDNLCHND